MEHPSLKYLRKERLPTVWCPGCGIGQILNYTICAVDELQLDVRNTLWVTGSGCSGRISTYWRGDAFYTLHGRSLAFATGAKICNPQLDVIVHTGDGEVAAIGGNHLIQTARRNVDITVICVNNLVYGMTGGQVSPTTPFRAFTQTTPRGNPEEPFDLCKLVIAAGGTYVARWTTAHPRECINSIKKAIRHKGFAFVEIMSQCPTAFGRRNKMANPYELMQWLKNNSINEKTVSKIKPSELSGKFVLGEFVEKTRTIFGETMMTASKDSQHRGCRDGQTTVY
jgi:2-oxoglutarate ferredoxin oxidoreductase subunit beta